MQALVQWMQMHARVLTTPSTSEGEVAGPSLPEEVEELHNAESATSDAKYWPVRSELLLPVNAEDLCIGRTSFSGPAHDQCKRPSTLALLVSEKLPNLKCRMWCKK